MNASRGMERAEFRQCIVHKESTSSIQLRQTEFFEIVGCEIVQEIRYLERSDGNAGGLVRARQIVRRPLPSAGKVLKWAANRGMQGDRWSVCQPANGAARLRLVSI